MDFEKPAWKIEAERRGESLPEYYTVQDAAKILEVSASYIARLARDYKIQAIKVGTVRFIKNEQLPILINMIRKK